MRLFMDSVVALMLVGLLAGVMWHQRTDRAATSQRDFTRSELHRFQQQIALQSALAKVTLNERGYPGMVDPNWFQGSLPGNPMLNDTHPWLEIAGPEQKSLLHPPERVVTDKETAKFWYNPDTGVIRSRVPPGVSDAATLELYNYINECNLPELFADGSEH